MYWKPSGVGQQNQTFQQRKTGSFFRKERYIDNITNDFSSKFMKIAKENVPCMCNLDTYSWRDPARLRLHLNSSQTVSRGRLREWCGLMTGSQHSWAHLRRWCRHDNSHTGCPYILPRPADCLKQHTSIINNILEGTATKTAHCKILCT